MTTAPCILVGVGDFETSGRRSARLSPGEAPRNDV